LKLTSRRKNSQRGKAGAGRSPIPPLGGEKETITTAKIGEKKKSRPSRRKRKRGEKDRNYSHLHVIKGGGGKK